MTEQLSTTEPRIFETESQRRGRLVHRQARNFIRSIAGHGIITIFTFLWAWNDFTGPLLFLTSPRNFTMALGLQDFQGQHTMV